MERIIDGRILVANHPNKHIRAAIKYAEDAGWTFRKAAGRAHVFGRLFVHNTTDHAIQKITRKTSVEPSIDVLT